MSDLSPAVTPVIAGHVLHVFMREGMEAGSFTNSLITTISLADNQNRLKMLPVFPGYVEAVTAYKTEGDGLEALRPRFIVMAAGS